MQTKTRLARLLCAACLLLPGLAAAVDGVYRAVLDGTRTVLALRSDAGRVTGTWTEGALVLQVDGRVSGDRLQATVRAPQAGIDIAQVDAQVVSSGLQASIDAHNPVTGARKSASALFVRDGAAAAPAAPGSLDASLVGTWINEKMINSGGANFASFTTVMTMALTADGRVQQWSRSVGGGGDWNYDSAGELQHSGHWSARDGVLYVSIEGSNGFQPLARYRFSDQYLVTENDAGKLIWQRR